MRAIQRYRKPSNNLFIKSLVNILVSRNTYRVQGHDTASIRLNAPISVFFQIDLQRNIIRKQKFQQAGGYKIVLNDEVLFFIFSCPHPPLPPTNCSASCQMFVLCLVWFSEKCNICIISSERQLASKSLYQGTRETFIKKKKKSLPSVSHFLPKGGGQDWEGKLSKW